MAFVKLEAFPAQFMDSNGDPYAGGSVEFYVNGTSTPTAVYSDGAGTSLGLTVNLNSRGTFETSGGTPTEVYGDTSVIYKAILKDAGGATIRTYSDIYPPDSNTLRADLATNDDTAKGADLVGYRGRTVLERLDDIVNVKDEGATGDGVTDDTDAVKAAIAKWKGLLPSPSSLAEDDYGVALVFPYGKYLVDESLDFTSIRVKGATVIQEGSTIYGTCTGKTLIDCADSRFLEWHNFRIAGDDTSEPAVGLYLGISDNERASGGHVFYGMDIQGSFSKAAYVNHGSEENHYYRWRAWNHSDTTTSMVYCIARSNILSVASDFVTLSTSEYSTNGQYGYGCDFRKLNAGTISRLDGARNIDLQGYQAYAGSFSDGNKDYFTRITTEATTSPRCTDIILRLHSESPSVSVASLVQIETTTTSTIHYGIEIYDYSPQADSIVRWAGGAIGTVGCSGLKIRTLMADGAGGPNLFSDDGSTNARVEQADIVNYSTLAEPGVINLTNLSSFSGVVKTFDFTDIAFTTDPDDTAAIFALEDRVLVHGSQNGVNADAGDAAFTYNYGEDKNTIIYGTAITANRAVTLSTTGVPNGTKVRVVRQATATGAFNVNVGTGPLKALGSAGDWCDVEFNGTAWVLTASGSL